MSTNKSEHLKLHLWEPEDDFLRTEFNENFSALDGAVAGETAARTSAIRAEQEARAAAIQEVKDSISATGGNASSAVSQLRTELTAEIGSVRTTAEAAYSDGNPPFVVGSYQGNGTYGIDCACSAAVGFLPRLLIVSGTDGGLLVAPRGQTTSYYTHVIWGDNSVSWYGSRSPAYHLNAQDETYYYVVFR